MTEDDVKFLIAVEESKNQKELAIKEETEAALHEFRIRHELLTKGSHLKETELVMKEPIKELQTKFGDNLKPCEKNTSLSESAIKTKRSFLGIKPKMNK